MMCVFALSLLSVLAPATGYAQNIGLNGVVATASSWRRPFLFRS